MPIIRTIWAWRWRLICASIAVIFLSFSALFWSSERFWENTEYLAESIVFAGCLGEFLTEYEHVLSGEENKPKRLRLGRFFAIVLMAGLGVELPALVRTNGLFEETIAALYGKASNSDERSKKLEASNKRLGIDLTAAKSALIRKQSDLDTKLERDRQKTAIFQKQAAKAQLELQNRLAWRHLNPKQVSDFMAILRPFRGSPVLVRVAGSDPEANAFAEEIAKMFFDAEWRPLLSKESMTIRIPVLYGAAWNVDTSVPGAKAFTEVAKAISTSNKVATLNHASLATSNSFPAVFEVGLKPPP